MAITLTNLATNIDAGTGTSFNTPTISPTAGQLILVWVYYYHNPTVDIPFVSGLGISFTRAQNIAFASDFVSGQIRSDLWWGVANPGFFSGAITIDISTISVTTMAYSVIGATSNVGVAQMGQSTMAMANGANYAYNLPGAVAGSSTVLSFWSQFTTATYTAGTGYTGFVTVTGTGRSIFVESKPNAGSQAVNAIGGGGTNNNRTAAVEILENTAPTATVTAPTGTTTNPTPTVTWTYSDAQGDTQSAYQVKVFSTAQYSIGGFDPNSSPNSYDSGVVVSASTSQITGSLSGGSYRAYVRVSDVFSGFGGWSFSSFSEAWAGVASITDAQGDLSSTAVATAQGLATMAGLGDISGFATQPLCLFPYIIYDYGGAFFCGPNLGIFSSPIDSNVRNLCVPDC